MVSMSCIKRARALISIAFLLMRCAQLSRQCVRLLPTDISKRLFTFLFAIFLILFFNRLHRYNLWMTFFGSIEKSEHFPSINMQLSMMRRFLVIVLEESVGVNSGHRISFTGPTRVGQKRKHPRTDLLLRLSTDAFTLMVDLLIRCYHIQRQAPKRGVCLSSNSAHHTCHANPLSRLIFSTWRLFFPSIWWSSSSPFN